MGTFKVHHLSRKEKLGLPKYLKNFHHLPEPSIPWYAENSRAVLSSPPLPAGNACRLSRPRKLSSKTSRVPELSPPWQGHASLKSGLVPKGSRVTGHKKNLSECRPAEGIGLTITCLHREDDGLLVLQGSAQLQHQGERVAPAYHQLRAGVLLGVVGNAILQALPVHLGDSDP